MRTGRRPTGGRRAERARINSAPHAHRTIQRLLTDPGPVRQRRTRRSARTSATSRALPLRSALTASPPGHSPHPSSTGSAVNNGCSFAGRRSRAARRARPTFRRPSFSTSMHRRSTAPMAPSSTLTPFTPLSTSSPAISSISTRKSACESGKFLALSLQPSAPKASGLATDINADS